MSKKVINFLSLWGPVVLWAAAIFKLSSGSVPSASQIFWQDFAFKKSAHMFFYGVLASLIFRAMVLSGVDRKKALLSSILWAGFYGVTDEFHQSFTQGREARLTDVGFDTIGAAIFVSFLYTFFKKYPKWEKYL